MNPSPRKSNAPIAAPTPMPAFTPVDSPLLLEVDAGAVDVCVDGEVEIAASPRIRGIETASGWFGQDKQQLLLLRPQHHFVVL
ncbi:hypothetical protein H2199_003196 [Coniosporium tulheliwenetii]|uniref:Uncharacterized protein n=1 Tax=Coniosporium tulheliwenetii TaxID=3383036 RepID=A0ACC2ZBM3_9PEZI|nr:hypothetical protein H2199_003196 [Cladosporium sp. JES 115]